MNDIVLQVIPTENNRDVRGSPGETCRSRPKCAGPPEEDLWQESLLVGAMGSLADEDFISPEYESDKGGG
jgi:hypothetical protein